MRRESAGLSRRYQAALRQHLKRGRPADLHAANGLGRQAMTLGLETLDVAKIHEQALTKLALPGGSPAARATALRRAGIFFARAITPIEKIHRTARESKVRLGRLNHALVPAQRGTGGFQMAVESGNRAAQARGGSPHEKRATLRPVVGAVAAAAGTIAAAVPPASVGAGGRAQEDQPRAA